MAEFENSTIPNPFTNITSYPTDFLRNFLFGFNFLFGPPTHSYVLWLIVTGGRVVSEFLQLNLCACEVVTSMSSLLYLLEIKFPQVSSLSRFTVGLLTTGRPLFQCLICVERYLAVVHPVTFLKFKPLRYRLICCTAAWIICFGSCVFTSFTVVSHQIVYMYGLLVQFFLFLFINLFCSSAVIWTLKQHRPGERGREGKREENSMKRRASKFIVVTTVTVLILFVPTIITGCFYVFSKYDVSNYTAGSFLCLIMSGFVQPVLYFLRSKKMSFLCCTDHVKSQK